VFVDKLQEAIEEIRLSLVDDVRRWLDVLGTTSTGGQHGRLSTIFERAEPSFPLGGGPAWLAFAAPPPKGREGQEHKSSLQKAVLHPVSMILHSGAFGSGARLGASLAHWPC